MTGIINLKDALRLWFGQMGRGCLFTLVLLTLAEGAQTVQAARMQQQTFTTPESAVEALIAANQNNNTAKLLKILGPHSELLIFSGDAVADKAGRERFLAAYNAGHKLESNGEDRRTLVVGAEAWPMPIPLVRTGEVWRFDSAAGEQEILNRRIGRNELSVIQVCRAYVEAQREFAERKHEGGKPVYARRFHSTWGKQDGLYWHAKPGQEESPLGPFIAAATAEGYGEGTIHHAMAPYHGYYYKILTRQGEHASGGTRNYLSSKRMVNGFAVIAYPARYGDSGVMTFLINQDGIVYEKNLGPKTIKTARKITRYDPDSTWKIP